MNLFYSKNTTINNKEILLTDQENRHLTKVLRRKKGDSINVTNGKGVLFKCIIVESKKKNTKLEIKKYSIFNDDFPKIKIAISLTKKTNRFEWFLEKATEIGVSEITPIISENTEKIKLNYDRSNKLLLSAMKQSLRYKLPILNLTTSFVDYVSKSNDSYDSYIAICSQNKTHLFKDILKKGSNSEIIIGPEGGFTNNEIDLAKKVNFTTVSLGNKRLRTETAGIIACSIFSTIN
tara:strand:- start:2013 stop:2717 length:705 start_codon:yes stop_codon:yes gene_type:complete